STKTHVKSAALMETQAPVDRVLLRLLHVSRRHPSLFTRLQAAAAPAFTYYNPQRGHLYSLAPQLGTGPPPRDDHEGDAHRDDEELHDERDPESLVRVQLGRDAGASGGSVEHVEHDADQEHDAERRDEAADVDDPVRRAQAATRIHHSR